MEQTTATPWRIWVSPERKIVSFHAEAGFRLLEFRTQELFLRCIDGCALNQYRHQSERPEKPPAADHAAGGISLRAKL